METLLAKRSGLYEAIPGLLWGCDLAPLSSVFVETINKYQYSCYKLTWSDKDIQPRNIVSEKVYIKSGSFEECLDRAKYVIDWYKDLKK